MSGPSLPRLAPARWLELSLDERCNLRCLGCRACHGGPRELAPERALRHLQQARQRGTSRLWIGGGEPTLRPELPALLRAARSLGFTERLVQTNALRLAYPAYTDALVDAGLTSVRLNLKSLDPALHDQLSGLPGAHALLERALDQLARHPLPLLGDVLLARPSLPSLAPTLAHYASRGVRTFSLWLLSAHDSDDPAVRAAIPSPAQLSTALTTAADAARQHGFHLESLHTPWCLLPPSLHALFRPAASWGLVVVDPSDRPFPLDASPLEGGAYLPSCAACARRPDCPGPRADYLALHGPDAFRPLTP